MRELPSPPVLVNWHGSPYIGGQQHAFAGPFDSACERLRWTARLTVDPTAKRCPECVALIRMAVHRVLEAMDLATDGRELAKGGLIDR